MTQRFKSETHGATFTSLVTPLPGCNDIAVSHGLYRTNQVQGRGKANNLQRCEELAELGYSAVLCTVDAENDKQRSILEDTGWIRGGSVRNKKTGHWLCFYYKGL